MLDAEKLNFIEHKRLELEELLLQTTGLQVDVSCDIFDHHQPVEALMMVAIDELGWKRTQLQSGLIYVMTEPLGHSCGETTIFFRQEMKGRLPDADA